MAPRSRPLTKSRFVAAHDCPRKLVYLDDPAYADLTRGDSFLEFLAEGGFQVGALAQASYPGGVTVETLDSQKALEETRALLKKKDVVIFEAALGDSEHLIRVDILVKRGQKLRLIEVKAKSYDPSKGLGSSHRDYLLDVAYQLWVAERALPDFEIEPFLMLTDVSRRTDRDGLHQLFKVERDARGRARVVLPPGLKREELGEPLLIELPVRAEVERLWADSYAGDLGWEALIEALTRASLGREEPKPQVSGVCKNCRFRVPRKELAQGERSGFEECWRLARGWGDGEFSRAHIFELGQFRGSQKLLDRGVHFLDELTRSDLKVEAHRPIEEAPLQTSDRQWLQTEYARDPGKPCFLNRRTLRGIFESWRVPFHFIDFETSRVAIPFHRSQRPYGQIAFQFSHHVMDERGELRHAGQFLGIERGRFPNFDFVRALKGELERDPGSVFIYSQHEVRVLEEIAGQLGESSEPDREELIRWISSLETVDLFELIKEHFMHPLLGKSTSLKVVLPTVLEICPELRERYLEPVHSLNFGSRAWLKLDAQGRAIDPYLLLPGIEGSSERLADGSGALAAYSRLQFEDTPESERQAIARALLRYCELDTLAMAVLVDFFRFECFRGE